MRWIRIPLGAALWAVVLAPCLAHAAGYAIFEQGARALGMAGAHTASVQDASALFYNPAALTRLEGSQFMVGGTWLTTRNSFAGTQPYPGFGVSEEMKSGNFFPPVLYLTHRYQGPWAVGIGVNAPFGLGIEWQNPEQFTGRKLATKAQLTTLNTNATVAWAATPTLSLAAGFDMLMSKVELHRINTALLPGGGGAEANVAEVKLEGGFKPGYGFNLGALLVPDDQWRFGLSYRSKIEVEIDGGDATFTQILTGNPSFDAAVAAGLPPAQGVKTTTKFPAMFALGAAWDPAPEWTWELSGHWTEWSAFDELKLEFDDPTLDSTIPEEYEDQFQVRLGAEHRCPGWAYRFGYYYDQAAAPIESVTPLLPDANRHGATLGLGFQLGSEKRWSLDLYNLALFVEKRSTEGLNRDGYEGTYKAFVNAAGATLAYRW